MAAREGREPRGDARDAHGRARPRGGARFEWPRLPRRGQLGDGLRGAQRRVPALRARPRGRALRTTRLDAPARTGGAALVQGDALCTDPRW